MIKRLLIANRGEIAVRIIRTCRMMNITTIAIYSEADKDSLHVQLADEAYCIGPNQSIDSYLDIERILEACRMSKAERSEEHTSELQSRFDLVCRLLLEKKKKKSNKNTNTKT